VTDKTRKPEPAWIGRLSRTGVAAQRMQGKSRGTFGPASTVKQLMAWSWGAPCPIGSIQCCLLLPKYLCWRAIAITPKS
jgi:hypothetical protein